MHGALCGRSGTEQQEGSRPGGRHARKESSILIAPFSKPKPDYLPRNLFMIVPTNKGTT